MATLMKCFGALVASGNGNRCDSLRSLLRSNLLVTDKYTGQSKVWLHKFGRKDYPNFHKLLRVELAEEIDSLYRDISPVLLERRMNHGSVLSTDNSWRDDLDKWHFSDILENAMRKGKWNGTVGTS